MIHASLSGRDTIEVVTDADGALVVPHLQGATRTARMPPLTWHMPLTVGSIAALRGAGARASSDLVAEAQRMMDVQHFIETQKQVSTVEPIASVPIKAGCSLYNHQTKAFNIALALMGYDIEGGHIHG